MTVFGHWLERMEHVAIGFLGLTWHQFESLTPRELYWRIEAEQERENRELERFAQLACWVLSPWMGRGSNLTVKKLIKRRPRTE